MGELDALRSRIDALDAELVAVLASRMQVCAQVARYKAREDIPMMQEGRVAVVLRRCAERGVALGLRSEFLERLYSLIIGESCTLEDGIIAELTQSTEKGRH